MKPLWNRPQPKIKAAISFGLILLIAPLIIFGQEKRDPDRGFVAGGSYALSDVETINTTSGNLMLNIPLASLPAGRGPAFTFALRYNSKLWDSKGSPSIGTDPETGAQVPYTSEEIVESSNGGWKYSSTYQLEVINRFSLEPLPSECNVAGPDFEKQAYLWKVKMRFPDGSVHEFRPAGQINFYGDGYFRVDPNGRTYSAPNCGTSTQTTTSGMTYYSTDGSFLRLVVDYVSGNNGVLSAYNPWTLYYPDGGKVVNSIGNPQRVYDRNGNYISLSYLGAEDEFGRAIWIESDPQDSSKHFIKRRGFNGEEIVMTVKWKTVFVYKMYDPAPGVIYCTSCHSVALLRELGGIDYIELPDESGSLRYTFGYNGSGIYPSGTNYTYGWGELNEVQLPSGATVNYKYAYDGYTSTPAISPHYNTPTQKDLHYDAEYNGTSTPVTETWQYYITEAGSTITEPNGAVTSQMYGNLVYPNTVFRGYVFQENKPDGTKIERIWNANAPEQDAYFDGDVNPYVKTEFTSIQDTLTAAKDYDYDKNGNVIEVREYDWMPYASVPRTDNRPIGLPSNASLYLKRKTVNTYWNDTPAASSSSYNDPDSYHLASSPRLLNLIKATEVQDAGGTPKSRSEVTYDFTDYTGSNTKGGNPTQTKSWDSFKNGISQPYSNPLSSSNSISTSASYNNYGMPLTTTDAKGYVTQITYGNITTPTGTVTDLYPTQTVIAYETSVARTSSAVYDFHTGLVTSATDVDNNVSTATVYDALGRPTKIRNAANTPLESWTQTEYNDLERRIIVRSDLETISDGKKVAIQHFDQLGRVRLSRTLENAATESPYDETHGIKVQTRYRTIYDSQAQIGYTYQLTSNPYRASTSASETDPTMGWTLSTAWSSGKHSEVQSFSGSALPAPWGSNNNSSGIVKTDTDADRTLVTDQAGKQRISRTNALGQLKEVWEVTASDQSTEPISFPNQTLSAGYRTSYSYDTLNNLTTVSQGVQTRSFTYSSLSRLTSATNPESGTISYQYDSNGNLTKKTDARLIETNYVYDALNRVTNRNYLNEPQGSETPDVTYTYGTIAPAIGKLKKVESSVSTTEYTSFDILGRVTGHKQTTDGGDPNGYTTGYTYNLSGGLVEETYPSGRVVKNVLDNNGDLSIVQSKKNAASGYWNYAENFTYNSAGAVTSMQLGNGRWESTVFNSRLQPTQIALGTVQSGADKLDLQYAYGQWEGGILNATKNNGNIAQQIITVPTVGTSNGFTAVQKYYYDSLNRIDDATEEVTGQTWRQDFSYDRYGNRSLIEVNTTTIPRNCGTAPNFTICDIDRKLFNPAINTSNNRLSASDSYGFDSSGNTTANPENRIFIYDGENKQVAVRDGNITNPPENPDLNLIGRYWYDGDGKRIMKYVPSTGEVTVFVYDASGKLVAEYSTIVASTNDAKVAYLTNDHLGSPRINTDRDGKITSRHDYHPFGEEIATPQRQTHAEYAQDSVRKQFTGYERDGETGLDFAQARYHDYSLGRFRSPDYFRNDTSPDEPQSWNLFVFVRNNPLALVDPSGEKAKVTIQTNLDEQTGTITISASFGVYARKGVYSQKELNKHVAALKKQIEGTFKGGFVKDGIEYTVKTNVTVSTYSNEAEAIASGSDNVVGLVKANYLERDTKRGTEVVGATYNLGGDQDHMVFATGARPGAKNYYAHEFGHALGTDPSHTSPFDGGKYKILMQDKGPVANYLAAEDFNLIFATPVTRHKTQHWIASGRTTPRPPYARMIGLYNVYTTSNIQRSRATRRTHPY